MNYQTKSQENDNFQTADSISKKVANAVISIISIFVIFGALIGITYLIGNKSFSFFNFFIVFIIFLLITFVVLATSFVLNLKHLEKAVKSLSSGNADLTQRTTMKKSPTTKYIIPLSTGFNDFIEMLQNIVIKLKKSQKELGAAGENMSLSTQDTTASISQILANIESIHNQIDFQHKNVVETTNSINEVTEKVSTLEELTQIQSQNAENASASVKEMASGIEEIDNSVENMSSKFNILLSTSEIGAKVQEDANEQIQRIVTQSEMLQEANQIISAIAEQTNLLAMNAAIEAAHAGDAGKGFSVVADEIRKLSETSTDQSNAIGQQLISIKDSISQVVVASEKSLDAFRDVSGQIKDTDEIVKNIKSTMSQQTLSSDFIKEAVQAMAESSKEVKISSHEISEKGKTIFDKIKSIEETTEVMAQNMSEMSIGAGRINETAASLDNISKKVQGAIKNISQEIDQFKV